MKKTIIGLLSVVSSLACVGIVCAVDKPAQESVKVEGARYYPVSFDTPSYHVTVAFPIPSRKIEQRNPDNRMYVAQGQTSASVNDPALTETFSMLYQSKASLEGQKVATAEELAQQFEKILSGNKGVVVKELQVAHQQNAKGHDQSYLALKVIDHDRTDYYVMRFIVVKEGVIVATHTVQEGKKAPDLKDSPVWAFVDSVTLAKS